VGLWTCILPVQSCWLGVVCYRSYVAPRLRGQVERLSVLEAPARELVVMVIEDDGYFEWVCDRLDQFGDAPEPLLVVVLDGQALAGGG